MPCHRPFLARKCWSEAPPNDIEELYELRRIRNDVVHNVDADVSLTDALRYRDLASRIVAVIEQNQSDADAQTDHHNEQ